MPRLSEHEVSGAIGMLQADVRISDITQDRHRSGQPDLTTQHQGATLTTFFVQWHYPFCFKIIGEETFIPT